MLIFKRESQALNDATDFVMRFRGADREMAAIKHVREALLHAGFNGKYDPKTHRRRLAILPPPLYVWLCHTAPEILCNPQLLKTYLRNNPGLLVIDKENL